MAESIGKKASIYAAYFGIDIFGTWLYYKTINNRKGT